MKKKLTVQDRANLITQLTPDFEDFDILKIVESIEMKVQFGKKEIEAAQIQFFNNGNVTWNVEAASKIEELEVDFTQDELKVINDQITLLHSNKRGHKNHLPTIRKFWKKPGTEKQH